VSWMRGADAARLNALSSTLGLPKAEVLRRAMQMLEHAISATSGGSDEFAQRTSKPPGSTPPREELITELRELARRLGHTPSTNEWNAQADRSCSHKSVAIIVGGGTWTEALAVAGLGTPKDGKGSRWDAASLIAMLQAFYQRTGSAPTQSGWDAARKEGQPSEATFRNTFGTWNKALEAAGLPTARRRQTRWPREVLIGYLRDWYAKRGDSPTQDGWDAERKPGQPSEAVFRQRFGSWNKALAAAGLPERNSHATKGHRTSRNRQMVTAGRKGAGPVRWDPNAAVEQINTGRAA